MMDSLRKPLFIVAVILLVLAVLIELGSGFYIGTTESPGYGIRYLAILDGLVLFTIGIITAPLLIPASVVGRVQGIISFLFSLLMLIGAIVMASKLGARKFSSKNEMLFSCNFMIRVFM